MSNEQQNKNNSIFVVPIVYGTCAFWLGKKADETVSHKWCIFVRGNNSEDISSVIKEVSFTLHTSFTNHIRTISTPPYELYESGWGEFDIKITIYLHDPNLKSLEFVHGLKLYPFLPHHSQSTKKPVLSENYDEIILVNPKMDYFPKLSIEKAEQINENDIKKKQEKKEKAYEKMNNQEESESVEINDINLIEDNLNGVNEEQSVGVAITDNLGNKNPSYFSGIDMFFFPISDENNFKQLQEVNSFVTKEISRLKYALEENDLNILGIKRSIKEITSKFK